MPEVNFLTDDDVAILRRLVRESRNTLVNGRTRGTALEQEQTTPEVYVIKTPVGGIPAIESLGTGDSGTQVPGSAECDIYRLLDTAPLLYNCGFTKTIYNLSRQDLPEEQWLLVVRDKFGSWYAIPEKEESFVRIDSSILENSYYPATEVFYTTPSTTTYGNNCYYRCANGNVPIVDSIHRGVMIPGLVNGLVVYEDATPPLLMYLRVTSATPTSGKYPAVELIYNPEASTVVDGEVCWVKDPNGGVPTADNLYLAMEIEVEAGTGVKIYQGSFGGASSGKIYGQANTLPSPIPEGPRSIVNLIEATPSYVPKNFAVTLADNPGNDSLDWTLDNLGHLHRANSGTTYGPRRRTNYLDGNAGLIGVSLNDSAGADEVEATTALNKSGDYKVVGYSLAASEEPRFRDDPEVIQLIARHTVVIGVRDGVENFTGILNLINEDNNDQYHISAPAMAADQFLQMPIAMPTSERQFFQVYQLPGAPVVQAKWTGLSVSTSTYAAQTPIANIDNWEQIRFTDDIFRILDSTSNYGIVDMYSPYAYSVLGNTIGSGPGRPTFTQSPVVVTLEAKQTVIGDQGLIAGGDGQGYIDIVAAISSNKIRFTTGGFDKDWTYYIFEDAPTDTDMVPAIFSIDNVLNQSPVIWKFPTLRFQGALTGYTALPDGVPTDLNSITVTQPSGEYLVSCRINCYLTPGAVGEYIDIYLECSAGTVDQARAMYSGDGGTPQQGSCCLVKRQSLATGDYIKVLGISSTPVGSAFAGDSYGQLHIVRIGD